MNFNWATSQVPKERLHSSLHKSKHGYSLKNESIPCVHLFEYGAPCETQSLPSNQLETQSRLGLEIYFGNLGYPDMDGLGRSAFPGRRRCVVGLLMVLVAAVAGWKYLKSPYEPKGATATASTFIREISRGNWQRAHALTFRNGYTGRTVEALRLVSARQLCGVVSKVSWLPPQSHGNRLRLWLKGLEADQDRVWVEFHDDHSICMISVEVRKTADDGWKIFNFQSHAG